MSTSISNILTITIVEASSEKLACLQQPVTLQVKPVEQKENNHMLTAMATVFGFIHPGVPNNLVKTIKQPGKPEGSSTVVTEEKQTRTVDGLIKIGNSVGLNAQVVKSGSVEAYEQQIAQALLESETPVIAPFLLDGRQAKCLKAPQLQAALLMKNTRYGQPY